MKQWILKRKILEVIQRDQELYGKVAKALGVSITSMHRILARNSSTLTEASVLNVLSDYLKLEQKDLIESIELKPAFNRA